MEYKSSIENFENLTFEIVDEKGRIYKFSERRLIPFLFNDLMLVYLDPSGIKDEGFKFEAGKEYKIRVFDSKSSLVVEDGCVFSDESEVGCKEVAKCVAHPSRFNRDYYEKVLSENPEKLNFYKACDGVRGVVDGVV